MKVYRADEVADRLQVSYKTVLELIKRGRLKALPGLRHKRITEEALNRYLGLTNAPAAGAMAPVNPESGKTTSQPLPAKPNGLGQAVASLAGSSARPSGVMGGPQGQIVGKSNGGGRGVAYRVVSQRKDK